jgi:hypothetical protein
MSVPNPFAVGPATSAACTSANCPSDSRAIRVITPNDSPEDSIASNTIRTARSRSSGGYRRYAGCEPLDRPDMDPILPTDGASTRPGAVQLG